MAYADTLAPEVRKRGRIYAYLSSSMSCISSNMLTESATVVIYMTLLNCSESFMMRISSFPSIFAMLLMLPASLLVNRFGKKSISWLGSILGCAGFMLMALAPLFGPATLFALMSGCLIYSLNYPFHNSSWYTLIDDFLTSQDRGSFLGTMRYIYMCVSCAIIFLLGVIMGKNPPQLLLQVAIGFAGIMFLGRGFFNWLFPENPHPKKEPLEIRAGLRGTIRNRSLIGYSAYTLILTLATGAMVPLTFVYLKKGIGLNANTVQLLSVVSIVGQIISFMLYSLLLRKTSLKFMEILVQLVYATAIFILFAMNSSSGAFIPVIGVVLFMLSFSNAANLCNNSIEMLSLADPENRTVEYAVVQTYKELGGFIAKFGSSCLLGSTILASSWNIGSRQFSNYQAIFLCFGILSLLMLTLIPLLPSFAQNKNNN